MASDIGWPPYLPQLAEVEFEVPDTRLQSQTDIGPAKIRNRYTFAPVQVSGRLVLNAQQTVEFMAFYSTTLKSGTLTFNWQHPVTDVLHEMRFKSVGKFSLFKTGHSNERTWFTNVVLELLSAA